MIEELLRRVKRRVLGEEHLGFRPYKTLFTGKTGIEIGGPSGVFKTRQLFPVYEVAKSVDGVNFSTQTIWENTISAGRTYDYGGKVPGTQFILEASKLAGVPDEAYDFLLSSHSLEHCANAIATLYEWKRVIKPGGTMLLLLPNKEYTFDQKRPVTLFSHLLDDYHKDVGEDDQSHLDEILSLHDLDRDPGAGDWQSFRLRSLKNYDNRCLHHHVFDLSLLESLLNYVGMEIKYTDTISLHLLVVASRPVI